MFFIWKNLVYLLRKYLEPFIREKTDKKMLDLKNELDKIYKNKNKKLKEILKDKLPYIYLMNRNKNNQNSNTPYFMILEVGVVYRSLHKFPLFFKYLSFEPDKAEALNLKKKFKKNKNFESLFIILLDKKNVIKIFIYIK